VNPICFYGCAKLGVVGEHIDTGTGQWRHFEGYSYQLTCLDDRYDNAAGGYLHILERQIGELQDRQDYRDMHLALKLYQGGMWYRVRDLEHAKKFANMQWVPIDGYWAGDE